MKAFKKGVTKFRKGKRKPEVFVDEQTVEGSSGTNTNNHDQVMDQTAAQNQLFQAAHHFSVTNSTITAVHRDQINNNFYCLENPMPTKKEITADVIEFATPALPKVFTGRDELVAKGVEILCQDSTAYLAILGAGGIGKTSLALHISRAPKVQQRFQDKIYFLPCDILEDADALMQGIFQIMGLPAQEGKSKQNILFGYLKNCKNDLLFIMDNFENPWNHKTRINIKSLLEKLVGYDKVSIIVTMRGYSGPGDNISWQTLGSESGIPTLSPAAAKKAFTEFVGQELELTENSQLIDQLLEKLEYTPLAIRLSAQHAKKVPLNILLGMWESKKTAILKENLTKPGRLTSVEFSIDLSVQFLNSDQKALELLSSISFLPSGIPFWVQNLKQMLPSNNDWGAEVSMLLDTALIYSQSEGLKMLAPVREYIQLQLEVEKDQLQQLTRFYDEFLNTLSCDTKEAQKKVEFHIHNIGKIFKFQSENLVPKQTCISALYQLDRFSKYNSITIQIIDSILKDDTSLSWDEGFDLKLMRVKNLRWTANLKEAEEQALSIKKTIGENIQVENHEKHKADQLGRCYGSLSEIYYNQIQLRKAIKTSLEAQKQFIISENQQGQARSLHTLGNAYLFIHRYADAFRVISEAQNQFEGIGDQWGVVQCLQKLGDIQRMQDNYSEATRMLSEAQNQFEGIGDQLGAAQCLKSLGDIQRMQNNYSEATRMLSEAQNQFKGIGDQHGAAQCLQSLWEIQRMLNDYSEATRMLSEAQNQFEGIGNQLGAAQCLQRLGDIQSMQNNYSEATRMLSEAQNQFKDIGDQLGAAQCLKKLGDIQRMLNNYSEATRMLSEAQNQFEGRGDQLGAAQCLQGLGNIQSMLNNYSEATRMLSEAQNQFKGIGDQLGAAQCLQRLGDIQRMQNNYSEATKMLSEAQKQFEGIGDQLGAAQCLQRLGEIQRMQNNYSEATRMLSEAQKQFEDIRNLQGATQCMQSLGKIYCSQSQYNNAIEMFLKAQAHFQDIRQTIEVAACFEHLGITYRLQKRYDKAKESFNKALELSAKEFPNDKYLIGYFIYGLGEVFQDMHDLAEARKKFQEAQQVFTSHGQLQDKADMCSKALDELSELEVVPQR